MHHSKSNKQLFQKHILLLKKYFPWTENLISFMNYSWIRSLVNDNG